MDSNFNKLMVIATRGCEQFVDGVKYYLSGINDERELIISSPELVRFGSGEGKVLLHDSMRGADVYIICDCFNHGVTYEMYGEEHRMSPDDHYSDLKRIIGAVGGKARRITVIMPMLYEGRQHKRSARESLDCALALQELENIGVSNIITFDAHDGRVENAIPLTGFDSVRPTYQMLKALVRTYPDISLSADDIMVVAPDEGALSRSMYYATNMKINLGMFYKVRDYTRVVKGKNPIIAHEYMGCEIAGRDVIVVDDMIASGGSILDVARQLKKRGAGRIFFFTTFGLFTEGFAEFDKAFEEGVFAKCFTTNLVYHPDGLAEREWYGEVNMCKYVATIIDTLNRDSTISVLLNPLDKINNILAEHNSKVNSND